MISSNNLYTVIWTGPWDNVSFPLTRCIETQVDGLTKSYIENHFWDSRIGFMWLVGATRDSIINKLNEYEFTK